MRNIYYILTPRGTSNDFANRTFRVADSTEETQELINYLLDTYGDNFQRVKASENLRKQSSYVVKRGQLFLDDYNNNSLIPDATLGEIKFNGGII